MKKISARITRPSIAVAFTVIACVAAAPLHAWNRSEIHWKTIETEHFSVHYHPGEEASAGLAAVIAEEIYGPITSFYCYDPGDRVHVIISDVEDEAAGATYYYLNKIEISASEIEFHLRGTANWLQNVITHEFTHMVSLQCAMKLPRHIPALYLQVVSFEREKRPDVITGYPNFQGSLPLPGEVVPNWFAEGIAQYQCRLARNDIWDSHRDMLLRVSALNDRLLTLSEMGVFGKNSLGSEMVYNQGFSLVMYIADRYGHEKLADLTRTLSSPMGWSFDSACRKVLGVSDDELYAMWKEDVSERYRGTAAAVVPRQREGERIAGEGFLNLFPVSTGIDGGVFFLSNAGGDYMDLGILHAYPDGTSETIAENVTSGFGISPDGKRLCYARTSTDNAYGYSLNDVFMFDLGTGRERRLTNALRASYPTWSPDGTRIACVVSRDGSDRLAVVDPDTGMPRYIDEPVPGRQYYGLSWGTGGIVTSRFDGLSRDIVLVEPGSGRSDVVLSSKADERDPCWDSDGTGFLYASDRTGIFNIYHHRLADGSDAMVTDCIGGAFSPSVRGDACLFTAYGPQGYVIRRLPDWRAEATAVEPSRDDLDLMEHRLTCIAGGVTEPHGWEQRADSTGEHSRMFSSHELLGMTYTSLFVFPRLLVYENKPRLGLYVNSLDILDRLSVAAGASMNLDKEFDLQIGMELKRFKPTFSFDLYRSRKYYDIKSAIGSTPFEYTTRYDLWDAYFTCTFEFERQTTFSRKDCALQYNHGEYGLNISPGEVPGIPIEIGWTYYRGNELSLLFHYRRIRKEVDAGINPRRGRVLGIEVTRAYNKLDSGTFEYGFQPIYDENRYGRYRFDYEEFVPLPFWSHALSLKAIGGIIDNNVDDFFFLFLGSRDGLRGYSYYSMGGRKMALGRLTYRFPVLRNINRQFLSVYISSVYAGLFAEAGKAWNEDELDLNGNKKDLGFEVRVKGFSFYNYPLAASFEAAYGLSDVRYTDPFNEALSFNEGKSWKYYGSILFDF